MMEYEEGGLSDQGGTVDPVSGNEVPPGALQEEVRDDIDAKLSEGEFVFPADVVRYIGLEKLMMMRQQAKQGLSMMEKMGQMSNADEAVMEDTAPAAVFDIPDDMDMPAVMVAELEMAEGGDVQGEKRYKSFRELMGTDGDTAEIVTYVNDAGRKIIIMHMNGAPVSQVPEGFYPEGTEPPEEETEVSPEQPPAPPQMQPQRGVREDDPSDPPEKPGGGVIHTGGYVDSQKGRVIGSTAWDISYDLDGGVTLENSEHGKVTLTKEEAAGIGVGLGGIGVGSVLAAFSPEGVAKGRERQAKLSSGEFGNPAAGNEIHKALIEKATLQKMGEQFVKSNSEKVGLGDSIASAFGLGSGKPNEIEGNISQILGKPSTEFTDSDYAIIGQALSGTPNQYNLPGATQTDAAKLKQISDAIDEIQSGQFSGMSLPKPKPTRNNRGLAGLSMPDITLGKIGDSDDDDDGPGGPPSGISGDDPFFDGDQSGTPGSSDDGFPTVSDPLPDVTVNTQPGAVFDDDDDDEPSGGGSYSIGSGAPVDAFNERPGLGGGGGRSNPGVGSFSFSGGGSRGFTGGFNKGALVKKRKGLASR